MVVPALFLPLITLIIRLVGISSTSFGERRGHWTRRAVRERRDLLGGRCARARCPRQEDEAAPRIDPADGSGSEPDPSAWRLRHLMYLVAGVAVLFWLVVLAVDSIVIGSLLVWAESSSCSRR